MQKLDAVVATAGAVILVVAIAGAALSGGGATRSSFDVAFPTHDHTVALPPKSPIPARDTATFTLNESNLVKVNVAVHFAATAPFPPTATAHVKLVAPNGTVTEKDGAPAAGATSFDVRFEKALASPPTAARSSGADAAAAERAMWMLNSTAGQGNWTLEVSFASGTPLPAAAPGDSMQASYGWTAWNAKAQAISVPTSR
ncbi:MAG: hypothetical protein WDA16_00845 [Candidatus Thermoplasmatota archaeon]